MCKDSLYIAKKSNYGIYMFMTTKLEDIKNILDESGLTDFAKDMVDKI